MHDVVRTVFAKLHVLDPVVEEDKLLANAEDAQEADFKLPPSAASDLVEEANMVEMNTAQSQLEPPQSFVLEATPQKTDCKYPSCTFLLNV
jgi:hypothetical protein